MFKKTVQSRIFQDLVDQIENAILEGKLKVGDKLPPQREMVEMFQTSRGSLREALRVLELKGLIDIKLGVSGGAVVKAVDAEPVVESLGLLISHKKVTLNELAEFREGVEGNIAALAAERASSEDIHGLKKLLNQAREYLKEGVSKRHGLLQVDKKIHVTIADIAGNSVYQFVLRMVQGNINRYYESTPLTDLDTMEENYQDLCDIVTAIEQGKGTAARSLIQGHVRRFNRYMLKKQQNSIGKDSP